MLLQLLMNGLVYGCLYAIMAFSFALIYNTTRLFHVAHGSTYIVAAYLCFIFLNRFQWSPLPAIIAALMLTALLGLLMEKLVYAPLAHSEASLLVSLLSSLGLYISIVNLIAMLLGNDTKMLYSGLDTSYRLGTIVLTRIQILQILAACIILPAWLLLLKFSRLGRIFRAMRDNPRLVTAMGINLALMRLVVFGLGSATAGVVAILSAMDTGIDPNAGLPVLLVAVVALIIGGVGTFEGPMLGGILLGLLQGVIIWKVSARWADSIMFGVLILFLLFRPQGLTGKRRRLEEGV